MYKDYDFDLTHDGLENLRSEKPEVYAMHVASKTFIMQQDGMPMHQPSVKPIKILHPMARVLTTSAMLSVATEKDNVIRKDSSMYQSYLYGASCVGTG